MAGIQIGSRTLGFIPQFLKSPCSLDEEPLSQRKRIIQIANYILEEIQINNKNCLTKKNSNPRI